MPCLSQLCNQVTRETALLSLVSAGVRLGWKTVPLAAPSSVDVVSTAALWRGSAERPRLKALLQGQRWTLHGALSGVRPWSGRGDRDRSMICGPNSDFVSRTQTPPGCAHSMAPSLCWGWTPALCLVQLWVHQPPATNPQRSSAKKISEAVCVPAIPHRGTAHGQTWLTVCVGWPWVPTVLHWVLP